MLAGWEANPRDHVANEGSHPSPRGYWYTVNLHRMPVAEYRMVVTRFRIPVALFRMVVDFSVYEYVFYRMVVKMRPVAAQRKSRSEPHSALTVIVISPLKMNSALSAFRMIT